MEEFDLEEGEFVELCNLLKLTGLCGSGGMAKVAVSSGLVKVDGSIELRKRCKIRAGQRIDFEGEQIAVVSRSR
ncbi:MAG: RNA-binding protein [Desulfuromonas sp.]|nr:MAG: RNA-binding protein [Desulfuromonas sp.]